MSDCFFHAAPNTAVHKGEQRAKAVAVPVAAFDGRQGNFPDLMLRPRELRAGALEKPSLVLNEKALTERSHHDFPFSTDLTTPTANSID